MKRRKPAFASSAGSAERCLRRCAIMWRARSSTPRELAAVADGPAHLPGELRHDLLVHARSIASRNAADVGARSASGRARQSRLRLPRAAPSAASISAGGIGAAAARDRVRRSARCRRCRYRP